MAQKRVLRWAAGVAVAAFAVIGLPSPAHAAAAPYTALGDSYSSGVGTREYYSNSGDCKRSPKAYPVIDAARNGLALTFVACSGATASSVQSGQLSALSTATRYVTVSAGGNDAGFAKVIEACARPWPWTCWGEIDGAKNFIRNTLPGRLDSLYRAIRQRAPNAKVVVVGYPRIFNGQTCNLAARISNGEQKELNATADLLAQTTAARAGAHGYTFVDSRNAFTGHAVCDNPEWINGLSNPIQESYHPNQAGQVGYANLVGPHLTGARSSKSRVAVH